MGIEVASLPGGKGSSSVALDHCGGAGWSQETRLSAGLLNRQRGKTMAGFTMRKNKRFKKLAPVRYVSDGVTGEGVLEDLSLTGSYITGKAPVSLGMVLELQILLPEDPDPLRIERAIVKWVAGPEFGVEFDTPQPKEAERIRIAISELVKTEHSSSPRG